MTAHTCSCVVVRTNCFLLQIERNAETAHKTKELWWVPRWTFFCILLVDHWFIGAPKRPSGPKGLSSARLPGRQGLAGLGRRLQVHLDSAKPKISGRNEGYLQVDLFLVFFLQNTQGWRNVHLSKKAHSGPKTNAHGLHWGRAQAFAGQVARLGITNAV